MSEDYRANLRSRRWQRLKWRRAMLAGFRCEGCGRKARGATNRSALRKLDLHHKHYLTVGRESLEDVELLCHVCHPLEHGLIPEASR